MITNNKNFKKYKYEKMNLLSLLWEFGSEFLYCFPHIDFTCLGCIFQKVRD